MNHVIIIDDEVQSRNGIAEIFKNHSPGWEIDGLFEDGSLALDYLQQHPEVNLVVTDIRMPKFDGLELISRIRKNNGTIPIIIISGYSEFSYAKKAVEHHVFRYILKPIIFQRSFMGSGKWWKAGRFQTRICMGIKTRAGMM